MVVPNIRISVRARARQEGEYCGDGRTKKKDWGKIRLTCVYTVTKIATTTELYDEPAACVYVISVRSNSATHALDPTARTHVTRALHELGNVTMRGLMT